MDFFIHEKAMCECTSIGAGTRIWAFAHVMKGAKIGAGCNLGESVFVETEAVVGDRVTLKNGVSVWAKVELGDDVFVGPNAVFTNDLMPRAFIKRPASTFLPTFVKRGATIGANATIVCGVTIGEYAFIGAGTVVTTDVPAFGFVLGVPGKIRGKVCYCGMRLDANEFCRSCKKKLVENSAAEAAKRGME